VVRRYDQGLLESGKEAFAVLVDGEIVSTCESSRENEQAGEAWVRTLESFRRRGFARQVTAAWGHWLMQRGKVPFYSHVSANQASRAVAQSLGLVQYIEDAGYE
jgi:predicted GNAT family acetyltransferase